MCAQRRLRSVTAQSDQSSLGAVWIGRFPSVFWKTSKADQTAPMWTSCEHSLGIRHKKFHLYVMLQLIPFLLLLYFINNWLSLSWPRLSRITAYLEVKIRSLPKHENLTTGSDPSIPGLVTIVLIPILSIWWCRGYMILPVTGFRLECAKINRVESDNYPQ